MDLDTGAHSGTPPGSDPENSTDGRATCQLGGRLATGRSGARREAERRTDNGVFHPLGLDVLLLSKRGFYSALKL